MSLYLSGRIPHGAAETVPEAIDGLRYILGQIEGCAHYNPNIGQVTSATSSLRLAIEALSPAKSSLIEAAREAGWALGEIVDEIAFAKRQQVADIAGRLALAIAAADQSTEFRGT